MIDPGLGLPELGLTDDEQVRCLAYLMRNIRTLAAVPPGVGFEIIPAEYLGGPYPAIGLFTHPHQEAVGDLSPLVSTITDRLQTYIAEIGVQRLLDLSGSEPLRWEKILAARGRTRMGGW